MLEGFPLARLFGRGAPFVCRTCLQQRFRLPSTIQRSGFASKATPSRRPPRARRRRQIVVAASGTTLALAGVVTLGDDVKHKATAAPRVGRVVYTLMLNVNEYAIAPGSIGSADMSSKATEER